MENKVTFTTQVKEEICQIEFEEWQLLSLIAGFVKVNGELSISSSGVALSLHSENSKIAKLIYNAFKKLFNVSPSSSYTKKMKLDKGVIYGIKIDEKAFEILEQLNLMEDGLPCFPRQIVLEERLRYFIAGVFLASGSVNSPLSKNYHLQIVISDEDDAKYFLKLLKRFRKEKAMDFKMITRRNKYVLYLKKADQIATFISIIHAHSSLLDFENARIEKDFINSDNRVQVCYNANYQKTLAKGEEQIKEIEYIKEHGQEVDFSDKEKAIMEIRLNNVDMSLTQISEVLKSEYKIALSKSGINHIFNKIHDRYERLKKDEH